MAKHSPAEECADPRVSEPRWGTVTGKGANSLLAGAHPCRLQAPDPWGLGAALQCRTQGWALQESQVLLLVVQLWGKLPLPLWASVLSSQ